MTSSPAIVYDACAISRILSIPIECNEPVPQGEDNEIVVYYGGWSLRQLCATDAGTYMWHHMNFYDEYGWKADPGYYRLLLPVPDSNRKSWSEQLQQLPTIHASWQPAPVCVAATALLAHLLNTMRFTQQGDDLLEGGVCRCAEACSNGNPAALFVTENRVAAVADDDYNGGPDADVWLSAARKS